MPNVLEAPEVLEETQAQQSQEATHPLSVLPPARRSRLVSIYHFLRAFVASYHLHHPHRRQRFTPHHQEHERPIDTLARKYPGIFTG
jgi:hypothetical protein